MKTSRNLPITVLIGLLLTVTIGAATVWYELQKPASVSVVLNTYAIELYTNDVRTAVVASIDFPDIMENLPSGSTAGTVECPTFWIGLKDPTAIQGDVLLYFFLFPNTSVISSMIPSLL